jgi:hypothetical protein
MVKLLIVAMIACVAGFAIGYAAGWHRRLDDPTLAIRAQMREAVSSQVYATSLSLSALLALEKGDIGKAKSQLARQVATYQHTWAEYDGVLPGQPKLLPIIQQSSTQSETLREELARNPQ